MDCDLFLGSFADLVMGLGHINNLLEVNEVT